LAYGEEVTYEQITIDPNRMRGLPSIRCTRVTVSAILGQLAAGRGVKRSLPPHAAAEMLPSRLR
jgi:uncharacterized protein (DUF433 family)